MSEIDIDDREVFVAVVEAGSFTDAAQRLRISLSQVSKRVKRLEGQLGAPLLIRTTRHVSTTPAGARYHARLVPLIQSLREADAEVVTTNVEPSGLLRVAAPLSFGLLHVEPVLSEMALRWPDLRVDASFRDTRVDPLLWDVTIRGGRIDTDLVGRRLCPLRVSLAAAPAYLEAHGTPTHPDQLRGHRLLEYSESASLPLWTFQRGEASVVVENRSVFRADNGDALVAAAVRGLGVIRHPDFLLERALEAGHLVRLLPDWKGYEGAFWALTPTRHPSAAVRAFVDRLHGRCALLRSPAG